MKWLLLFLSVLFFGIAALLFSSGLCIVAAMFFCTSFTIDALQDHREEMQRCAKTLREAMAYRRREEVNQ